MCNTKQQTANRVEMKLQYLDNKTGLMYPITEYLDNEICSGVRGRNRGATLQVSALSFVLAFRIKVPAVVQKVVSSSLWYLRIYCICLSTVLAASVCFFVAAYSAYALQLHGPCVVQLHSACIATEQAI